MRTKKKLSYQSLGILGRLGTTIFSFLQAIIDTITGPDFDAAGGLPNLPYTQYLWSLFLIQKHDNCLFSDIPCGTGSIVGPGMIQLAQDTSFLCAPPHKMTIVVRQSSVLDLLSGRLFYDQAYLKT